MVPPSVVVANYFLILTRKPTGTVLGGSCLKSGTGKTGLLLIQIISDQCTYTCLPHTTPFYAFISYILIFAKFPDWGLASVALFLYLDLKVAFFFLLKIPS